MVTKKVEAAATKTASAAKSWTVAAAAEASVRIRKFSNLEAQI